MIGVLALQGDFIEHKRIVESLEEKAVLVKTEKELSSCAGLIIPGGESTAISTLLKKHKLLKPLEKLIKSGLPVYATCAGLILLAKPDGLGLIDAVVERNSYGRQTDSFEGLVEFKDKRKMRGIFIRAPRIRSVGKEVEVLAVNNGDPVVIRQKNILCSTFHPELSEEKGLHRMLISMCSSR